MTLRTATLDPSAPDDEYPFGLAVVRALPVDFDPKVTVFVGENGSGKSTLVEAIAVAAGFNAEGGSRNAVFATERTDSPLGAHLRLTWRAARRLDLGYFLRAESFYNVASDRDRIADGTEASFHELSHGESFLEVARQWFGQRRLFLLDEPESALSFTGQLALVAAIRRATAVGAQFVLATHSPLLMAIPGALVYELDGRGLHRRSYDELDVVRCWQAFLDDPPRFLRLLDLDG